MRAEEGGNRGLLRDRGGIRRDLTLDSAHRLDDLRRSRRVPDPPTGHGIRLRDAIDKNRSTFYLLAERGDARMGMPVVGQRFIRLIRNYQQVSFYRKRGDRPQLFQWDHGAGRIAG